MIHPPSPLPHTDNPTTRASLLAELGAAAHVAGNTAPEFFRQQFRLREAFAEVLKPGNVFAQQFTASLQHELERKDPNLALAVDDVLDKRAMEQAAWLKILTYDKPFRDAVVQQFAQGSLPAFEIKQLSPQKQSELVERLAQSSSALGPESKMHIESHADGEQRRHAAIARAWQAGGQAHQALGAMMQASLPDLPPAIVTQAVDRFIEARRWRAQAVADAMQPGSPVVQEALNRCERSVTSPDTAPLTMPNMRATPSLIARLTSVLLKTDTPQISP